MNKKECPYCHTETYYTGAAGEREVEEPQEYLYNYEFQDDLFSISVYVLKGYLYFKVDDQNGQFADRLKINYCPKCGRKLTNENKATTKVRRKSFELCSDDEEDLKKDWEFGASSDYMPVSDEYRNWLNDPILGNIRSVALMIAVIYG